ncbi:hypothetical protein U9M48_013233 [Paspalum notatum var. saurae]|uniref:Integrase catalytic domain-containing protein n=1 Tax=Paspalum notatum var. saurae TaxID=547442 RepID=A0AAQ3T191_PASNO
MELRKKILDEAHTSMFTMHPGSNKMYQDLKQKFWWTRMKREIAKYAPTISSSSLEIGGHTYGLHCGFASHTEGTTYRAKQYAELYISWIVSLHGVPQTITLDRGSLFVSRFWEQLQIALGTNLIRSSAYHAQTSGQVKRVNQILEDMLRACALTYSTKWDECLPLAEFAYNNSYQKSLEMAPFKALYGRRYRTPLNWSELGERVTFSPDLVTQAEEQVRFIYSNLKRAQSRQKSYSDRRRRQLAFEESDHVYLRVSPMKGVHRFGVKEKLGPRYVGPFKITERCGLVAYRLELPPHLAAVHDVFHVSQLKKCLRVPKEVVDTSQIQIQPDLTYEEKPIRILDQKQRSTRRRNINFYKVQWSNHSKEEAIWEQEEFLQTRYLGFLPSTTNDGPHMSAHFGFLPASDKNRTGGSYPHAPPCARSVDHHLSVPPRSPPVIDPGSVDLVHAAAISSLPLSLACTRQVRSAALRHVRRPNPARRAPLRTWTPSRP